MNSYTRPTRDMRPAGRPYPLPRAAAIVADATSTAVELINRRATPDANALPIAVGESVEYVTPMEDE